MIVRGVVQDVGFRYFTYRHAHALMLTGWVRNRSDGSVEVTAEGPRDQLEALLDALRKGPPDAFVSSVEVSWLPATNAFCSFEVA